MFFFSLSFQPPPPYDHYQFCFFLNISPCMHMISILYIQTYIGVICLLDQISAGIDMRIVFVLRVYGYIAGISASIEIEDSYV